MTEQGAGADNASAVEPREAQRPTSLAARTPTAAILGNGDIAVGALAGREVRPAGSSPAVQGSRSAAPWRLPALHPLVFEGKRKTGYGLAGARKMTTPAQRSVGLVWTGREILVSSGDV